MIRSESPPQLPDLNAGSLDQRHASADKYHAFVFNLGVREVLPIAAVAVVIALLVRHANRK